MLVAEESHLASAVCHLTHPDGPWQQHTLISSALANLSGQWVPSSPRPGLLFVFTACSFSTLINLVVSLDTTSALGGKSSCLA